MKDDVYKELLDDSKTITKYLDNAHYVGKFTSQVPNCGSSMKGDEGIDSSLRSFDGHLEMEFQLHEKNERYKLSNKGKKSDSKNSKSNHNSSTLPKIVNKALDSGKRLSIFVIGD